MTEHASGRFGGEAALPLHYFRELRRREVDVWLITHERVRAELEETFPEEHRIVFIEDKPWQRALWRMGRRLPDQVAYVSTGFLSRTSTMRRQRAVVRRLIAEKGVAVVHQPTPVSPREPSFMFGLPAPLVVGPMNGGMEYPPGFGVARGRGEQAVYRFGRLAAGLLNRLLPGKRQASVLLVANQRTRDALPRGLRAPVVEIVENGVDLSVWRPAAVEADRHTTPHFVYMGRLIDWKAVDLLLQAVAKAARRQPLYLSIIGDGDQRESLVALAGELGLTGGDDPAVRFLGWLSQAKCADILAGADGLVLSSLLECGGAVVLEAMALGKPVVATAWGGPVDYLDETCGVLVPPTSPGALVDGLAEALVRLSSDPQIRRAMGAAGAAKVRRDFDWEVKVDQVIQVYRDVLAARGASR